MKTWVLLCIFLGVTEVVAEKPDTVECRSSWCTPSAYYRHQLYGKEVCCDLIMHSYMVVRAEREGHDSVEKCYCSFDFWARAG
ncbi:hypothetical protein RRG08_044570 [Elysia crispata]|uniref:Plethodontid modulating factor n=1 Tax=Elysia crispata TaxID=231223 RepID=A0AAE1DMF4_9GAST|nr:hypothetical protein RRG08_044570 [Elysia crispata]